LSVPGYAVEPGGVHPPVLVGIHRYPLGSTASEELLCTGVRNVALLKSKLAAVTPMGLPLVFGIIKVPLNAPPFESDWLET
jgi:hypothetical protein